MANQQHRVETLSSVKNFVTHWRGLPVDDNCEVIDYSDLDILSGLFMSAFMFLAGNGSPITTILLAPIRKLAR